MGREQWQPFLRRWSAEWIIGHDPENDRPLDDEVVRDRWLGFAAASAAEIAAAETRLGRSLPPSLREFLLVTNGWRDAGNFIYQLAGTTELAWLRDTDDSHWIQSYSGEDADAYDDEPDDGEILGRCLRISLDGDMAIMLLDPDDVDADGEWAGYWLASWSDTGPERHDSFYDLMYRQYVSFHYLCQPAGETRDRWDATVEQARLAALDGEIDEPMATLWQASEFGRRRAMLLHLQLRAMLGDWHTVPLSNLVGRPDDRADLVRDPLFATELLPLLFVEDRLTHQPKRFTLERLKQIGPEPMRQLIADYEARLASPDFRLTFGNPQFDTAVHDIVDRLTADPALQIPEPLHVRLSSPRFAFATHADLHQARADLVHDEQARQRLIDAAWPELRTAMRLWRPVSENHIAPVVLRADPVIAEIITAKRGREILAMRRGDTR